VAFPGRVGLIARRRTSKPLLASVTLFAVGVNRSAQTRVKIRNHDDRFAPSKATATVVSEQIRVSRAKPLRGAEGALDILICSEKRVAVAIDGFL
jgi:hypothetical protein